jgi:GT2 family glycosyltransferase
VTAILACHNRRALTIRALHSFFGQVAATPAELDAVLVDDGSCDGTAEAVAAEWPRLRVIRGTGSLYWAGAMAIAEREAVNTAPDYLLWLNDDVELAPHALERLLQTARSAAPAIAVGAVADSGTNRVTYSGLRRVDRHPMHFRPVLPSSDLPEVDTFNGNVVLVPREVYLAVGGIDGGYGHAVADFDYALRARRLGFTARLAPTVVGACSRRDVSGSWRDPVLDPVSRWRSALGPKGIPPRAMARYLRRYGGRLWWMYWSLPYSRLAAETAVAAARSCLRRQPKLPDDTTRIAGRYHAGRDVGRDDAPGADDAALSNSYAFQDD